MRSYDNLKREAKLREVIFNDKNDCKANIHRFDKSLKHCISSKNLLLHLDLETGEVIAKDDHDLTSDRRILDFKSKTRIINNMRHFIDNIYSENELCISKSKNSNIIIICNYTEDITPEKTIYTHFNTSCQCSEDLEWLLVIYPNYVTIPIIFGFSHSFGIKKCEEIYYAGLFENDLDHSNYSFTSFYNEFSISKTETVSTNIPSIKLDTGFVKANNYLSEINLSLIPESNKDNLFRYEDEYFISTVNCDGSKMDHYLKGDIRLLRYYDSSMIPFTDNRIFDTSEDDENYNIEAELEKYLYLIENYKKNENIKFKYYSAKYNISNHFRSYIAKFKYSGISLFRIDIFGKFEYIRYIYRIDDKNINIKLYKVESIRDDVSLKLLIDSYIRNEINFLSYIVNKMYESNNIWNFSKSNNICEIENYEIETIIDIKDKKIISSDNILSRDIDHTFFLNELGLPININYIDK